MIRAVGSARALGRAWALGPGQGGTITRDGARDAAHHEVGRSVYHTDGPGIVTQVIDRVSGWIADLFDHAASVTPGGPAGLVVILAILGGAAALLLSRSGSLRGARRSVLDPMATTVLGAADHRRLADGHEAAGQHAEAVRERMRAIVRELETRGVLEPRPGRTADEVAADAGAQVPGVAADLREAARIFDEVWYGSRPATAELSGRLRAVDLRVAGTPLRVVAPRAAGAGAAPGAVDVTRG